MKKTIIHVGLHKTATTYLQNSVWPMVPNYTYLSRPYTQHNHAFNQLQYADDSLYDADILQSELAKIGYGNLLISDESLSGKPLSFSSINRSMIARRLHAQFPEAEIILFLRDQTDIIKSHYSSYIKMPFGVKTIDQFLYKPKGDYSYQNFLAHPERFDMSSLYYNTNDVYLHLDCFKYSCLIELYSRLFKKCHVFLYEDFKRDQTSIIRKIETIMGQPIETKSLSLTNKSLSSAALDARRQSNILTSSIKNRYLRKVLQQIMRITANSSEQHIDKTINNSVANYYAADNQKLKKLLPDLNWSAHLGKYK
ncbi:MAG: hypothetical protein JKX67_11190 [Colwellia sp.]|nr:hypothetical protein [Colwellia sp.]